MTRFAMTGPLSTIARVLLFLSVVALCDQTQIQAQSQTPDVSGVAPRVVIHGDEATFTTPAMIVVVSRGSVTRLFNRLTGSEYLAAPASAAADAPPANLDAATGVVYAERSVVKGDLRPNVIGPTTTKAGESVLTPKLVGLDKLIYAGTHTNEPLSVSYQFRSDKGDTTLVLTYSLDAVTADLLIQQSASGTREGLAAIRWNLGPVVCRGNLLIPAFNGMKAARPENQYKFESATWGWPMGWQIPLIIFTDKVGGFSVHTQDPNMRFKEVMYRPAGSNWNVAFSTVPQAPFDHVKATDSVAWRVSTFSGDWAPSVDRYKEWAYKNFQIADKEKFRPKWVDDIKLVIKHADFLPENQTESYLDLLSKHVTPSETLLFLTSWKDDETKQPIPYWLPNEHGKHFAREARRRGFRVMYFANYIGLMPENAKFAEFKDHVIRDPFSFKLEGWNLEGEWSKWDLHGDYSKTADVRLYYVNPAYKPWRDFQISQFKQLFRESPGDGLFLDQAFLLFNDGNGLIDGMDTIHANLEFHRQIAEAIPGIALGGESVNEVTMQYESFCELHFLSLDLRSGEKGEPRGWSLESSAFDRMVPITSRFVEPHTRPMGYLGFPETSNPYYEGWRDALHVYNGIPTITKPTITEIEDNEGEVRRVMKNIFPGM